MEKSRILNEELHLLRERIISNHLAAHQQASGKTAKSLKVVTDNEVGVLYGRKAFGVLETGRKSGRVPKGFIDIIKQWSIDKGISFGTERERKTFSYFVAKKIASEGTKLYRSGGVNSVYSTEIPKTIERINERIYKIFAGLVRMASINLNS